MKTILRTAITALLILAGPALSLGAAHAAAGAQAASTSALLQGSTGSFGGMWAPAASSPTPSPGDTASTGPANPGTGESARNEAARLDYTPWVIGAVVLVTLVAILLWRRRRNTTIV